MIQPAFPLLLLALLGAGPLAADAPSADPHPDLVVTIPPRPADAIGGAEFARRTAGVGGRARQRAALAELARGNLPDFLRHPKPVTMTHRSPGGPEQRVTIWVLPDYLAVGADHDFLRIPLTYPSATAIAERFGCVLPTRKMVDAIYEQTAYRLEPQPMPPGPKMRSSAYYLEHQRRIERQRVRAGIPLGALVAGHKKDVVLSSRLTRSPGRIAIYGWHRPSGAPIQPLSTVHVARYADYSHGVRLIAATAVVDGEPRSIYEILADPELAPLLTYEGEIDDFRALMRPRLGP